MKNSGEGFLNVRQPFNLEDVPLRQQPLTETIRQLNERATPYIPTSSSPVIVSFGKWFTQLQMLGVTSTMDDDERRKLKVFNLLNFSQFIFGIIIPITAIITRPRITTLGWIAACMPALVSLLVLYLNRRKLHELSTLAYFILYPVITSIVYLSGMNLGIELFFILYGILAVFFIQDIGHMVFTVTLSMISYFILTVVWRNFQFQLEVNGMLYLFNHLIAIVFIFFGLYFLKKENAGYQYSILNHNRILREKNAEIELQKSQIAEKVDLLNKQANELQELNTLKNRLFSVIAHDLKSPIYALKSVFANIQQYDIPAKDVKALVPEIMNDLNYTTSLLENLLQWAKCQMQSLEVTLDQIDVCTITNEVVQLLNSQAVTKNICLVNTITDETMVRGHRDMIRLVLRNLVSNALKFTPEEGYVTIGIEEYDNETEIYVLDTGVGISEEGVDKIHRNDFFSTEGTASEKGTGLGLMLCKEFLAKNNSSLLISSEPGNGSRFAFRLRNNVS